VFKKNYYLKNIINNYFMRFKYESIVNKATDPESPNYFCKHFLMNNVALVKVEMATKSWMKSIKEKKV